MRSSPIEKNGHAFFSLQSPGMETCFLQVSVCGVVQNICFVFTCSDVAVRQRAEIGFL